jgi:hypothetical protein
MKNTKKVLFRITPLHIEILKNVCTEENVIWYNSAYGGKRFAFKINKKLLNKYRGIFSNSIDNDSIIVKLLRMVTSCHNITNDLKNKLNLCDKTIKILRNVYFDLDRNVDEICVTIANKRPFGNSDIIGDLSNVFDLCEYDNDGNRLDLDYQEKYIGLLNTVITKIYQFLIYVDIDIDLEAEYYDFGSFKPSIGYLRKIKLKKLFNM